MTIKQQIKKLCRGEVEFVEIDLEEMTATVLLPYESSGITIDLEGDSDEEIIESFKRGVNQYLDEMADHLNDCKFDGV